jgi:hypothetical protein
VGWTWRRSTSLGPLRFNFSKSGVGVSVGVRGARISTGPRGTYVHIGAGGFRYSQRVGSPVRGNRSAPIPTPTESAPDRRVEVVEPTQLTRSSDDDLLEEIRNKQKRLRAVPVLAAATVLAFLGFLLLYDSPTGGPLRWAALMMGFSGLFALPWAAGFDRRAGRVRVHYVLDPLGGIVQEALERLIEAFSSAAAVWSVHQEHMHGDWKRNAGAGTSLGRRRVGVGFGTPHFIETNAHVGFLKIDGTQLYFFPDRLLILGRGDARAIPYSELTIEPGTVRFVEQGSVPRDAQVLGRTWQYVNKDGGPDRRFKDNFEIPVVLYGTLEIAAPSGLRS